MKTNTLKSFRFPALLLSCVLMGAALAQQAAPATVEKDTVTTPPAHTDDDSANSHDSASSHAEWSKSNDDWTSNDTDSTRPRHTRHHRHNDDVVSIGHNANLAEGERADSVVAVFGSATSAGDVDDSVVSVMGNTHMSGRVHAAAVAVLGNVYVNGRVDGDVVAVLGSVELGPDAEVNGNVVVVGGLLDRDPGAVVRGHVQQVFNGGLGDFGWFHSWIQRCLLYGRPLAFAPDLGWAWRLALGLLALYAFLAFMFRSTVERCVQTLETHPGQSLLAAFFTMLLTPVVIALLCITVLGIAAIPFLVLGLLCVAIFGKVVVLASIGRRCTPFLAANPVMHTVVGVVVGGAIALVLYTIPIVGFIVYKLLGILGLGAVMYSLLLAVRTAKQTRTATTGAGVGAGVGGGFAAGPAAAAETPVGADFSARPDPIAAQAPPGAAAAPGAGATPAGNPRTPGSVPGVHAALLPRAGFWIRIAALLLDTLLVGIVFHQIHNGFNLHLLVLAAYGAVMWKLKASTVGGIICGLQVVRLDGREIDWATAIARALGCFLSLAAFGLGFLWIAIDPEKQSWHDKIAGTVVVRAPRGASLL
jgi:uncharacterized RDD family membrane protein YckC/cytoskeletal protein CcmA (bactofilin family)